MEDEDEDGGIEQNIHVRLLCTVVYCTVVGRVCFFIFLLLVVKSTCRLPTYSKDRITSCLSFPVIYGVFQLQIITEL